MGRTIEDPELTLAAMNLVKAFWRAEPTCIHLTCDVDCDPLAAHCGRMDEVINARQDTK